MLLPPRPARERRGGPRLLSAAATLSSRGAQRAPHQMPESPRLPARPASRAPSSCVHAAAPSTRAGGQMPAEEREAGAPTGSRQAPGSQMAPVPAQSARIWDVCTNPISGSLQGPPHPRSSAAARGATTRTADPTGSGRKRHSPCSPPRSSGGPSGLCPHSRDSWGPAGRGAPARTPSQRQLAVRRGGLPATPAREGTHVSRAQAQRQGGAGSAGPGTGHPALQSVPWGADTGLRLPVT